MTRWLVTGAGGMLGRELTGVLRALPGAEVSAADRAVLDVTDPDTVTAAVAGHDVVVNAAGWTDVDGAEAEEERATAVNGGGPRSLARACARHGTRLLHVSTDYVFTGDATEPYPENTAPAPLNAYGRGKLAGERAVLGLLPDTGFVVRTAWLYGAHGRNFVTTMLDLAGRREHLDVVDDQVGQPTWARSLAVRLAELGTAAVAGRAPAGIYHGTSAGQVTWYGLARAVFALSGLDPERIRPTTSDRFPRPARRPAYSVLAHTRWAAAGLAPMADWHDDLAAALPHLTVDPVRG
ncbi:dTDP-4-dehydrorhamnose reductase [Actinacidiphila acididurans]|uniref:dTDP-4-dehydrorhamnose reductase n=1 Tax=Actinacidiphila acididurans TaxID=2784346 RepID=A0ABS2TLZ2_9ACTN|nr:dTDP-4-dehydrorhamnose reductase [Actinacidiphila acididurans]MBM9503516.1 dTDP-4-dehydrorhamnose reductase [Actinacidiphila acididurans]